jgi:hypothetical protein
MARNFRSLVRWLVPSWLYRDDGEKVLWTLAAMLDTSVQRLREGLEARMPTRAGDSALRLIGADRGIPRGRSETSAHYAERLVRWRWPRGHRTRGSALAWLEQLSEYWGGLPVASVDVRGNLFERSAAGVETVTHGTTWEWDDEPAAHWSRFWGIIDGRGVFTEHPDWGDPGPWGGTIDPDSDYAIGQLGATPADVRAMRAMMTGRAWRPAGTRAEWIVVLLDAASVTPDSTWENWSYVDGLGVRRASRSDTARYWSLSPAINNVYAGNAEQFTGAPLVDGTYYEGDPESFPLSVTLPDGTVYSGDPESFPLSAQLLDDGDHL